MQKRKTVQFEDIDDENKYYLDDVDVEAVVSYAFNIDINSQNEEEINKKEDDIKELIEIVFRTLKKENEMMKSKNKMLEDIIKIYPLKKENEELKKELANIKKEGLQKKKKIDNVIDNQISSLKKEKCS